jgi:hypothetical protein
MLVWVTDCPSFAEQTFMRSSLRKFRELIQKKNTIVRQDFLAYDGNRTGNAKEIMARTYNRL